MSRRVLGRPATGDTLAAVPDNLQTGRSGSLSPVTTTSRRDAVMREIRRAIVVGTFSPGEKLTENSLAASLDVSRPTMREAVAQLAQDGLLVQEPYRGLRVADLNPLAIMEMARTRVALDMLAAEEILADESGRRLDLVRQAWSTYTRLPLDADPLDAHEAHVAFHRNLWAASENSMLLRLWPVTEAHLTIVLAYDQVTRHDPRRAHDVHERIVRALEARDLRKVRAAVVAHTVDSAQEIADAVARESAAS
jgi:DNA-binding GntR family transcriptional regulator